MRGGVGSVDRHAVSRGPAIQALSITAVCPPQTGVGKGTATGCSLCVYGVCVWCAVLQRSASGTAYLQQQRQAPRRVLHHRHVLRKLGQRLGPAAGAVHRTAGGRGRRRPQAGLGFDTVHVWVAARRLMARTHARMHAGLARTHTQTRTHAHTHASAHNWMASWAHTPQNP